MIKKVIISPFSKKLRNGKNNSKNYPYFQKVVDDLKKKGIWVIQIGSKDEERLQNVDEYQFDLSLKDLKDLVLECDTWVSVDNFMGHFGAWIKKSGIVIWGKSNPELFGYQENINLYKDKKYFRDKQFAIWEEEPFDSKVFVGPEKVVETILSVIR